MNKWKIISIVLISIIILFGLYSINNNLLLEKSQKDEQLEKGILSHYFQLNGQIMGTTIEDVECDSRQEKILLSNMVEEKPILIYRYIMNGCKPCIEKDLVLLTKYFKRSDSTLVRIIGSYNSRRDYLIANNEKKIKLQLYNIPEKSLDLQLEEYELSYCFVLHPNMKISNVFIPDQNNPEYTRQYFEAVKRFLDDQE